jgi:tRNA G37 N-methylase Trm5
MEQKVIKNIIIHFFENVKENSQDFHEAFPILDKSRHGQKVEPENRKRCKKFTLL